MMTSPIEPLAEALRDLTLAHFPWDALLAHMEEHTRD